MAEQTQEQKKAEDLIPTLGELGFLNLLRSQILAECEFTSPGGQVYRIKRINKRGRK